jgi:hypothetical protein
MDQPFINGHAVGCDRYIPAGAYGLMFALEPFAAISDELKPLFRLHWAEVAKNKELLRLDVDEKFYLERDRTKEILWVIARFNGRLVGYVAWFIKTHPHYKSVVCGQSDVHFLLPEFRQGWNGYKLLKNAILLLKALGVQYCYLSEKIGHEHPAIMKRLGFAPLDVTYSCDLTRGGP